MTNVEAKNLATRLGMSTWKRRVSDKQGRAMHRIKCIGFASADFVVAWGESWEEAFEMAAGVAFNT